MGKKDKKSQDSGPYLAKRCLISRFNLQRRGEADCSTAATMSVASDQEFPVHTAILTEGDAFMKDEERISTAACHIFHMNWVQRLARFYTANDLYTFRSEMRAVLHETAEELSDKVDRTRSNLGGTVFTSMSVFGDLLSVATWGPSMIYLVRGNRLLQLDERSPAADRIAIPLPHRFDAEHHEIEAEIGEVAPAENDSPAAVSLYQIKRGDFVVGWTKDISEQDAEFLGILVEHLRESAYKQRSVDDAVRTLGLYSLDTDEDLPSVSVAAMWAPPKKAKRKDGRKAKTKNKEKKNGSK